MTERQRPRETARAFRDSLPNEFVEECERFQKLARLPPDHFFHLRGSHARRCHEREIYLHSRGHWNWAIRLVFYSGLLDCLEVDLQAKRGTRPDWRVELQAPRHTDSFAVHGDVPQNFSGARY